MSERVWKWTAVVASGCALYLLFRPAPAPSAGATEGGPTPRAAIAPSDQAPLLEQLRTARSAPQACQIIERLDGAGGVAPLLEVLDRTRLPELRRCAMDALSRFDHPDAIARLGKVAGEGDEALREKALGGLARSRDPRATATVLEIAQTGSPSRRTEALLALAKAGRPEATELILKALESADDTSARSLVEALGHTHDPSVVPTLARLASAQSSYRVPSMAMRALGEIGDPTAIAVLESALTKSDGEQRYAAIALATVEDPAARRALLRAVGNGDEAISRSALYALRGFDGEDVKQVMVAMLAKNDYRAAMACEFFTTHPDPAATRRLVELARTSPTAARQAVMALKEARGTETTALMLELAGREGPARMAAIEALRGQPNGGDLVRPILVRLAADGGDGASEAVMALSDDRSPEARRALVDALRSGGNVASGAAFSLARRDDPESLRALEEIALSGTRKGVRQSAVMALSMSRDEHSIATMERLIGDSDGEVRNMAIGTVLRHGGPRAEALALSASTSKSNQDRTLAANGLADLGTPAAMARLKDMVDDKDSNIAQLALNGLMDKQPAEGKAILANLMRGDAKSRRRAMESASSVDVEIARPMIFSAIHDPDPQVALLGTQSISRLGGKEAQEAMVELLRAPGSSDKLRKAAAQSLSEMGGGAKDEYQTLIDRYKGDSDKADSDDSESGDEDGGHGG
jgi:HEAT repeat protein